MDKPKITEAMVSAMEDYLLQSPPSGYENMDPKFQREVRRAALRGALIAAFTADAGHQALEGGNE